MPPSNQVDDIWDTEALEESMRGSIDAELSTVLNEDFLVMDGLEIEDDFSGLLDLSPDDAFGASEDVDKVMAAEVSAANTEAKDTQLPEAKRAPERAQSPPRKRRRSDQSESSSCSSPSLSSESSVASARPSLDLSSAPTEDTYKLALRQLALSMQRSELTRNEIIRQRKMAEAQAKLVRSQASTVSNADTFLSGSRSTLTLGLEQSRRMLQSYMSQVKML